MRQIIEYEMAAHTADAEFQALAFLENYISYHKDKTNNYAPIGPEQIQKILPDCITKWTSQDRDNLPPIPKLKHNAVTAVLETILEKGPKAVENMDTKVAAYNVIRGHGKDKQDTGARFLVETYRKQVHTNYNWYEQHKLSDTPPAPPFNEIVESIHSLDCRGSLIGKIPYPLCEENNDLFVSVFGDDLKASYEEKLNLSSINKSRSFIGRIFDRKTAAR
ncbi:MAG: hypothetical protein GY804_14345 [Alphaproteobacteria bacterium]|nr:hypothetical protein [Alphaproteobacteria bacterium]